ncbi:MAG: mannitol dehydrogenase [Oscillospiraceae bacterium]|nr:mannitol dehydrogenase [Oscillospiraceae bacterium]
MKAVMYGAGNIGRGFIGQLLSQSGYEVTFIDVAEPVIQALQEKGRYPVRIVSNHRYEDIWVENVTALNGNLPEAAAAIADCDIMATAVGARILKFIVPNIVAGLRQRWAMDKGPLNIIICENLNDANKVLEEMLKAELTTEECKKFDETVGLVEASIGRMVPVQTEQMKDGEPMRICVEAYGFLPVDKAAFKGEIPEINNMVPFAPFDFYIKRKLYVHNMGHATCAYLGNLLGLDYIYESIAVPEVRILVQNAMIESELALSKCYGASMMDLQEHITDLLYRFTNVALKDTCQRVGGDPGRKLSPEDRLVGSSLLAMDEGFTPAYIAVGAAAGVRRYLKENGGVQSMDGAKAVLREVAQLEDSHPLFRLILHNYEMILDGCSLAKLAAEAEKVKHESMNAVV